MMVYVYATLTIKKERKTKLIKPIRSSGDTQIENKIATQ